MIRIRETRLLRFGYVGYVAGRTLLGYRILAMRKGGLTEEEYQRRLTERHARGAERLYRGVLRLQGLMIKIGQTIGSRPDVFPEEYARVLSRLQDQVPPHPWREMKPHIEGELGARIEDVFAEFNKKPVAAASLAQVYDARLKDGRRVAVKVVYPNSARLVKTDLRILRALIWLESRFNNYPLEPVYNELAHNVPLEVDMVHESQAMEAIASCLSHREDVVIPGVVKEYTTKRVLTMEYIEGIKITELAALKDAGIDAGAIFPLLVEVYFEQMLRHGYFHADPHPGNLFGLPGNRLALLDFGLTRQLTPEFRKGFKLTTRSIFTGDNDGFIEGMRAQGFKLKTDDTQAFVASAEFFRAMSDPEVYRDKDVLQGINDAWVDSFKKNPMVDMPGEMTLAMRVFFLLFGLGATVGRDIDLDQNIIPQIALKYAEEPEPEGEEPPAAVASASLAPSAAV